MNYKIRKDCRLCSALLPGRPALSLCATPPANEFVSKDKISEKQGTFPLALFECESCGHVQLPYVVDPERLFKDYVYVSGTSPVFIKHFESYANSMIERFKLSSNNLVVDIGSNDGTLLNFFRQYDIHTLGVDPAEKIAKEASKNGIDTIVGFLTQKLAYEIVRSHGNASLVTANNVFAHTDNLAEFAKAVKVLIGNYGVFTFEVSYLVDVCEKHYLILSIMNIYLIIP
jgi:hypothetical protein